MSNIKYENNRVKFYKNPARREKENFQPYVPQYQLRGVDPEDRTGSTIEGTPIVLPKVERDNVSYNPLHRRGSISNINDPLAETWSGIDGDVVEDIDLQQPMIDNNDFVIYGDDSERNEQNKFETSSFLDCVVHGYLLFIDNTFIFSGSQEEVEHQVRQLIFGEHPLYTGKIDKDIISVFKTEKMNIKVGVFVE